MSVEDLRRKYEASGPDVQRGSTTISPREKKSSAKSLIASTDQKTMSLGRATGKGVMANRPLPPLAKSSGSVSLVEERPPTRPPKKKVDALGEPFSTERELMLEKKILELQMSQLQLVERLATYEQHAMDEMRSSGGPVAVNGKSSDLFGKLRKKLDKTHKKKEAGKVLEANEEMDAAFWSPKSSKRKVKLDTDKIEILHPLTKDVGGSLCHLFVC
jgi:hypothetical protein